MLLHCLFLWQGAQCETPDNRGTSNRNKTPAFLYICLKILINMISRYLGVCRETGGSKMKKLFFVFVLSFLQTMLKHNTASLYR